MAAVALGGDNIHCHPRSSFEHLRLGESFATGLPVDGPTTAVFPQLGENFSKAYAVLESIPAINLIFPFRFFTTST